jgi:4-aminobutyrate aminotransferase
MAALKQRTCHNKSVLEVRGLGLLVGVEMAESRLAEEVLYQCLSRGLSFKVSAGTVLTLTPPLNILPSDLDLAIEALGTSIAAAEEGSFE